jgi:hypothetical protein
MTDIQVPDELSPPPHMFIDSKSTKNYQKP